MIEEAISKSVERAIEQSFTPQKAAEIYVQRFEGKEADVRFIATLLDVSVQTVRAAAKENKIKPLPRRGHSDWKFDMQYALQLKRSDLR